MKAVTMWPHKTLHGYLCEGIYVKCGVKDESGQIYNIFV